MLLVFAIIGLVLNRKNKFVISLAIFAGFLTLLSFGRHAQWFYTIIFDNVPFFNKFRAPMMSVTVTFFLISVLAAFVLSSMNARKKSIDGKENRIQPGSKSEYHRLGQVEAAIVVEQVAHGPAATVPRGQIAIVFDKYTHVLSW